MVKGFRISLLVTHHGAGVALDLSPRTAADPLPQQVKAFEDSLLSQLSTLQRVRSVGLASGIPYSFYEDNTALVVQGKEATQSDQAPAAMAESVSSEFFRRDIPLREGRWFHTGDDLGAMNVAVVSESMARRLWPGQSAVGKRLKTEDRDNATSWLTVVGVVGDVQHEIFDRSFRSILYLPYQQAPPHSLDVVVRGGTPFAICTLSAANHTKPRLESSGC